MSAVFDELATLRLVPVVVIDRAESAAKLGHALKLGGLPYAEITLRMPVAADAIREMSQDPELLFGAGTVLRADQVDLVVAAGARFVVSPGFSVDVVRRCRELEIPVLPGVATPTEVMLALAAGLEVVKFLPAESNGGVPALRAISAPFPSVRFVPTGGITPTSLPGYLALPSVLAVGGSWMVSSKLIEVGAFEEISRLSAEAVAITQGKPA